MTNTKYSVLGRIMRAKYRRMPIIGVYLTCSGALQPTVTRGSVEKYLQLGLRLSQKYEVGEYLRSAFVLASEELATLFKLESHQSDMNDYFAGLGATTITISESSVIAQPPIVSEIKEQVHGELLLSSEKPNDDERVGKRKKVMNPVEQYQTTLF